MKSELYFDRHPVPNVPTLIGRYSHSELASPYRSTVPLLSLVKDDGGLLTELLADLGMANGLSLHFEFTVAPRRGKGRESHTDLMVRSASAALAIEAKWTEPRYQTVGEWEAAGKSRDNRRLVAHGWLDLLQSHASRELVPADFGGVVYQMLHRAASACANSTREPRLAYLQFVSESYGAVGLSRLRSDLRAFHDALGAPGNFPFYLAQVQIAPTIAFHAIESLPKGTDDTACAVKQALLGPTLFEFVSCDLQRVTAG